MRAKARLNSVSLIRRRRLRPLAGSFLSPPSATSGRRQDSSPLRRRPNRGGPGGGEPTRSTRAPSSSRCSSRSPKRILTARTEFWCREADVTCRRVGVRSQKTLWGSCNQNGNLSFNWRLVSRSARSPRRRRRPRGRAPASPGPRTGVPPTRARIAAGLRHVRSLARRVGRHPKGLRPRPDGRRCRIPSCPPTARRDAVRAEAAASSPSPRSRA